MAVPRTILLLLLVIIGITATAMPVQAAQSSVPLSASTTVLVLKAGSGPGQVGITATDGPTTFRVASDGSYRVMDVVNKRILFFVGPNGKLQRTINLPTLGRPSDFAIDAAGTVYVLDAAAWRVVRVTLGGKVLSSFPLSSKLKNQITTLALTADGRLFGLGFNGTSERGFQLTAGQQPLAPAAQARGMVGAVTVRTNADFQTDSPNLTIALIDDPNGVGFIPLGTIPGTPKFVDVNLGMQPYVSFSNQGLIEVRRYAVDGRTLGSVNFDLRPYRTALRRVYVDRPGSVYTMQVARTGLTLQRFTVTDKAGRAVPPTTRLNTAAPWSPDAVPPVGVG